MKNCSLRMFNLLVIFTLFTTSHASCGDLCLLNFDSSDEERTNCIKVVCDRHQGPWNPAVKQYFMAEKRYQESGKSKESKENLIDNYQKRSAGTCVALCRSRYSSAKERIACVDAGCRAFFRDRISRIKKEVEVPTDNNPEYDQQMCKDSCKFTFTSLVEVAMCRRGVRGRQERRGK